MNVSDFRKRVKEMIEKAEQDGAKKPPTSAQTSRSQKEFDDAKVGMSFLILKNCLMASEFLAESFGADLTGLHTNCMEDPLFVASWDAYSRDMLANREFSPGMMVCFCLTSQMVYTYRKNTSRFREIPADASDAADPGDKRPREQQQPPRGGGDGDDNDDDDNPSDQALQQARPPTPPRKRQRLIEPSPRKTTTVSKTYNFEDYSAEDLGSDDTTSDEE